MIDKEENFTPISKMRFITSKELDPLTPYANSTGVYLDSDEDGMPDVVESYLANRSLWGEFGEKFPSLWGEYSWVSSYFWRLYDEDYENNHNATSAMQNATKWLQSQFNPLIKDHTPPVIVKFTIKWDVEGTSVYAKVHAVVRDVGKILVFKVLDEDSGEEVSVEECNSTRVEIEHKFSATIWQAGFGSVHMEVQAIDYAGNEIYVEKELKGALGQLIDALTSIWSAIWNTLVSVAKAVMSALNVILEWVKNEIVSGFMNFLEMYRDAFGDIPGQIDMAWNDFNNTGRIDKTVMGELWSKIMEVVYIAMAVWGVIMAILYIVMGLTFGLGSIVMSAIGMAIYGALSLSMEGGTIPEWLVPGLSKNELVRNIAQDIGERYNNSYVSKEKIIEFFLSLFSMGLSFIGWLISAAGLDVTGTSAGLISAAVATAALIFAGVMNIVSGKTKENIRWIVYGFSLIGIFMGVIGILKASSVGNPVSVIISLVGMVIGISTMAISIAQGGV